MHTIRFDKTGNQSVYEHDRKFPFCQRSFHRFIGEDVKIQCKWPKRHVPVIDYEIKWTLNGNEILNSDKRKKTSTRGHYNIETLSVFLIDKKDYGRYECWVSSCPTETHIGRYSKKSYMIAAMVITQINDIESFVYSSVGNVLALDCQIEISFLTKVLRWEYQIKSTLIGAITLEKNSDMFSHGCNFFSRIALIVRNYNINQPTLTWMSNTTIYVHVTICTCAAMYGKHSISITREFYNETTSKTHHVITPLRLKYIVLPDEYKIYNKRYTTFQKHSSKDIKKAMLVDKVKKLLITQIIEVFLIVLAFYTFWKHSFYLFDKHMLSPICKCVIKLVNLGADSFSIACLIKTFIANSFDYEYDVLILSTENDNDFITENLLIPCLENREYTVCFPDRDFDAGQPVFTLFAKALQSSHTIIVVCSKDFFEDHVMNAVVFEISNMSSEDGKLKNKNILFIKTDACEMSMVMKRYEVLDIPQLCATNSFYKKIYAWLQARIPRLDSRYLKVKVVVFFFSTCVLTICLITAGIFKNSERFSDSPLSTYEPFIFPFHHCCIVFLLNSLFQIWRRMIDQIKRMERKLLLYNLD
ncbi:Hypothetical predicted protein [Mytilus galloprovincialis]|uniref:Ig-like domain-containing protein n=1 Tax=Mytilus galloprovincialis TaxID=29158 RepID=A0A8B6H9C1_MYTGA|nr:Hypothetical predicted protein [Mytilus galloprovincialis]